MGGSLILSKPVVHLKPNTALLHHNNKLYVLLEAGFEYPLFTLFNLWNHNKIPNIDMYHNFIAHLGLPLHTICDIRGQ